MRRACKIDRNQTEIVEALRAAGATVALTHMVADGFPDLVVGYNSTTFLMEIKDWMKPPSKRLLTPDQLTFHAEWRGGPLCIVQDVEGALRAIRVAK